MNTIRQNRIKVITQICEHRHQLATTIWLVTYFLCRFLRPFSEVVFGSFMQFILYPVGIVILLYQLVFAKRINSIDRVLHLAIPGWFLVAGILRNGGISFDLLVSTCIIALIWCAMYWYGCNQEGEQLVSAIRTFFHVICGSVSVICLVPAGDMIYPFLPDASPWNAIGIYTYGRFWLLDNPNSTGMLLSVCLLGCLYLLWDSKGWRRFLWIGEALLIFICFVLTDSRTCFVQVGMAAGLLVFRVVYDRIQQKVAKWLVGTVVLLICTAIIYVLLVQTGKGLARMQQVGDDQQELGTIAQEQDVVPSKEEMIYIRPVDSVSTVGMRLDLWKAWLGLLKQEPTAWLYGTNKTPIFGEGKEEAGAHNVYISLLVCHGLPALLLFLFLAVRSAKPSLMVFLQGKGGIHILAIICLMFLINGLMETQIFYSVSLANMLFAVVAGFLMGIYRNHWIEGNKR